MPTTVAVAGGSSGLGRTLVDAFKKDGRYEVSIISRKENPELEKSIGVRILAADYMDVDSLKAVFEANKISIVISTANSLVDPTPEFNLIKAAAQSTFTKRFIPNAWSAVRFREEPKYEKFALSKPRLQALAMLRETDLEWTAIYPGLFMDYVVDGLPSHVTPSALVIDVKHNAAALPVKGEGRITVTYSRDIAAFVAKLLSLEKWEQEYNIVGDVKSWNEIVAAAEAGKGVKFNVTYDSIEKLQGGQVTELPGHEAVYDYFGGKESALPIMHGLFAQYGLWMNEGLFAYQEGRDGALLNDLFPEVKPLKVEEAWKVAGGTA